VLAEWDRATRSLVDGTHIMERVHKRGAYIMGLRIPVCGLSDLPMWASAGSRESAAPNDSHTKGRSGLPPKRPCKGLLAQLCYANATCVPPGAAVSVTKPALAS
jgi:hypothetical protein